MNKVITLLCVLFIVNLISNACCALDADIDRSGKVDFNDLSILADEWLMQSSSPKLKNTYIIAPYNTSDDQKELADYVCDGVADDIEINDALKTAFDAGRIGRSDLGFGGIVYLLPGIYNVTDSDDDGVAIELQNRVDLIGLGSLHSIEISGKAYCGNVIGFTSKSSSYGLEKGQFRLKNLAITASLTQDSNSWAIYMDNDDTIWLHDCIYENLYTKQTADGGMYVKIEWAAHYEKCTFEHARGDGYRSDNASGAVFNQCYFAGNYGYGCHITCGVKVHIIGCGFDNNGGRPAYNGPNTGESGLYIDGENLSRCSITNCICVNNSGSGIEINKGSSISIVGCDFYLNNWQESPDNAGLKLNSANTVSKITISNCCSGYNDGEYAPITDYGGAGYFLTGKHITLDNCISYYNTYGVKIGPGSEDIKIDVDSAGGDTHKFYYSSIKQISIGRTVVDTFLNVAPESIDAIKPDITTNTPVTYFDNQPDYPRNIIVTADDLADGAVQIQGITADGKAINNDIVAEEISIIPNSTVEGNIPWAKITEIKRTTSNGSIDIGWGEKLGLSNQIRSNTDVYKIVKNGLDISYLPVNAVYATIDCSPINIDGDDDFVIYYKGF